MTIAKAILELTNSMGDSNLAEHKAQKGSKFEDTRLTFLKATHEVYLATTTFPYIY